MRALSRGSGYGDVHQSSGTEAKDQELAGPYASMNSRRKKRDGEARQS